jgi:ribose transport system substrate-binding protein
MKDRRFARLLAVLAGVLVLALAGCTSGAPGGGGTAAPQGGGTGLPVSASPEDVVKLTTTALQGKKVRMVVYTDAVELQQSWITRIRESFDGTGIDFAYTSANFDGQVLVQQAQTALDQGADVLILHNSDLTSLANVIKKAQDAGVYVVVMNLGSNAQSDAYVGPNWEEMTAKLADRAADDCAAAGKNKVALITGFGSDTGSVLTVAGATPAFEKRGMQVVASQPAQFDPTKAADIARTLIQQHPDICALLGNWDGMMLGVAKVVGDLGLAGKVGVYTTDSTQESCDAIGRGTLTAAVNYQAGTGMGDTAAALVKYLLQSGVPAGGARTAVFTHTEIIDRTNYQQPNACYAKPVGWRQG